VQENEVDGRPVDERRPHVRSDSPEMIAVYDEVHKSLEDAIARGLAPKVDADYLAMAIIGVAREVGAAMLRRSPPNVDEAARFTVGLILKGLSGIPRSK